MEDKDCQAGPIDFIETADEEADRLMQEEIMREIMEEEAEKTKVESARKNIKGSKKSKKGKKKAPKEDLWNCY